MHENPGSTYTKSKSSQVTFNAGVSIAGDLGGVNLSAHTGWSVNEQISLTAPGSSSYPNGVRLCGSANTPPNAPQKLEYVAP